MVNWNHPFIFIPKISMYFIIPIILLVLPANYFDNGKSICLSMLLLDKECYACGMTRAIMHLIHLDFADAVYFNPISIVVLPLLMYVGIKTFWKDWQRYKNLQGLNKPKY